MSGSDFIGRTPPISLHAFQQPYQVSYFGQNPQVHVFPQSYGIETARVGEHSQSPQFSGIGFPSAASVSFAGSLVPDPTLTEAQNCGMVASWHKDDPSTDAIQVGQHLFNPAAIDDQTYMQLVELARRRQELQANQSRMRINDSVVFPASLHHNNTVVLPLSTPNSTVVSLAAHEGVVSMANLVYTQAGVCHAGVSSASPGKSGATTSCSVLPIEGTFSQPDLSAFSADSVSFSPASASANSTSASMERSFQTDPVSLAPFCGNQVLQPSGSPVAPQLSPSNPGTLGNHPRQGIFSQGLAPQIIFNICPPTQGVYAQMPEVPPAFAQQKTLNRNPGSPHESPAFSHSFERPLLIYNGTGGPERFEEFIRVFEFYIHVRGLQHSAMSIMGGWLEGTPAVVFRQFLRDYPHKDYDAFRRVLQKLFGTFWDPSRFQGGISADEELSRPHEECVNKGMKMKDNIESVPHSAQKLASIQCKFCRKRGHLRSICDKFFKWCEKKGIDPKALKHPGKPNDSLQAGSRRIETGMQACKKLETSEIVQYCLKSAMRGVIAAQECQTNATSGEKRVVQSAKVQRISSRMKTFPCSGTMQSLKAFSPHSTGGIAPLPTGHVECSLKGGPPYGQGDCDLCKDVFLGHSSADTAAHFGVSGISTAPFKSSIVKEKADIVESVGTTSILEGGRVSCKPATSLASSKPLPPEPHCRRRSGKGLKNHLNTLRLMQESTASRLTTFPALEKRDIFSQSRKIRDATRLRRSDYRDESFTSQPSGTMRSKSQASTATSVRNSASVRKSRRSHSAAFQSHFGGQPKSREDHRDDGLMSQGKRKLDIDNSMGLLQRDKKTESCQGSVHVGSGIPLQRFGDPRSFKKNAHAGVVS